MSSSEYESLVTFLNSGKAIYLEGVDVGTMHQDFGLLETFGTDFIGQGADGANIRSLIGNENTFASGLSFGYPNGSEADYRIDKIEADEGVAFFNDQSEQAKAIFYDGPTQNYRTILTSTIFGAYVESDGANTKANLISLYLLFMTAENIPNIADIQTEIDFEDTYTNYDFINSIEIKNLGYSTLTMNNFSVSGNGFSYDGETEINLEFGQSAALEISFSSSELGNFTGELTFDTNDPDYSSVTVALSAHNMEPPIQDIDLSDVAISGNTGTITDGETISISNSGNSPLKIKLTPEENNRNAGGPDSEGYFWYDSTEANGHSYVWEDIQSIGDIAMITNGEMLSDWIDLGFNFPFYNEVYSQIKISSNGFISFTDTAPSPSNSSIPSLTGPNGFIAPFWDNLDPTTGGFIQTYFDEANHKFIIQFSEINLDDSIGNGNYTFQVFLFENGTIEFVYNAMMDITTSGTVGIESPDGKSGLQVIYNSFYPFYHRRITFTKGHPWLIASPSYLEIPAGETRDVTIIGDSHNLEAGSTHNGILKIVSNDPENSENYINVTLNISSVSNDNILSTQSLKVLGNYPNPFNIGNRTGTSINFEIPQSEIVSINIYNTKGQKIKQLTKQTYTKGKNSVFWNGKNQNNELVSSGIYFYKISTKTHSSTSKLMIMK